MNQIFSFKRWWLVVGKHWSENRKRYTLSALACLGLTSLWFVFMLITDESDPLANWMQIGFYFTGLFIIGPFYASQFYRDLSSRPKGINYLLTPASALEKLLTGIFYSVVVFLAAYTAVFYLVDMIAVSLANAAFPYYNTVNHNSVNGALNTIPKAAVVNVFDISQRGETNPSYYFFLIFIAVQAFCLLGSVYFPRYSYIKLILTLCLLCVAIYFIELAFFKSVMERGHFSENMASYTVYDDFSGTGKTVRLSSWIVNIVETLFRYGFPVVFWLATYFRLKEKEI